MNQTTVLPPPSTSTALPVGVARGEVLEQPRLHLHRADGGRHRKGDKILWNETPGLDKPVGNASQRREGGMAVDLKSPLAFQF